jgi:hypothetical protein
VSAHLGVIQIGCKVSWTDQYGTHQGRVREVVRAADNNFWARVDQLPYAVTRTAVLVLLQQLRRLPDSGR